jgi:transcriptional regulator with XRE-family HTH domain
VSTQKHDLPNRKAIITPAQMRAGRALLGWSQAQLARAARVGLSTVKDAEVGKRTPMPSKVDVIRRTLEDGGVLFLAPNGDGPGVRLRGHRPELIRRPFSIRRDDTLAFLVRWRDIRVLVQLPTAVLDWLRGGAHSDFAAYLASFRRNEQRILEASARAIEADRFASPGFIELTQDDFPEQRGM